MDIVIQTTIKELRLKVALGLALALTQMVARGSTDIPIGTFIYLGSPEIRFTAGVALRHLDTFMSAPPRAFKEWLRLITLADESNRTVIFTQKGSKITITIK